MGIFVNAAALHDIPYLATIGRRAVPSQVISGAGLRGPARDGSLTGGSGALTGRTGAPVRGPYQRMANPS